MGIIENTNFEPLRGHFTIAEINQIRMGLKEAIERYSDYKYIDRVKLSFVDKFRWKNIQNAPAYCLSSGKEIRINYIKLKDEKKHLQTYIRYLFSHELAHSMKCRRLGAGRDLNIEEIEAELICILRGTIEDIKEDAKNNYTLETYYFGVQVKLENEKEKSDFNSVKTAEEDYNLLLKLKAPKVPGMVFRKFMEKTELWARGTRDVKLRDTESLSVSESKIIWNKLNIVEKKPKNEET